MNTIADGFDNVFGKVLEKIHKKCHDRLPQNISSLNHQISDEKVLAITFCSELYDILGGDPKLIQIASEIPAVTSNSDFWKYFIFSYSGSRFETDDDTGIACLKICRVDAR